MDIFTVIVRGIIIILVTVILIYATIGMTLTYKFAWKLAVDLDFLSKNRKIIFGSILQKAYWKDIIFKDMVNLMCVFPGFFIFNFAILYAVFEGVVLKW